MAQIHSNPREIACMKKTFLRHGICTCVSSTNIFPSIKNRLKKKNDFNIFAPTTGTIHIFLSHRRKLLKYFSLSAYHTLSHVSVILSAIASLLDIPSGFRDSAQIISVTRFVFPHPCRNPSSVDVFSGDLKKKKEKKNPLEL